MEDAAKTGLNIHQSLKVYWQKYFHTHNHTFQN